MRKLAQALLVLPIVVLILSGCTESLDDGLPRTTYHSSGWKDNHQAGNDFSTNPQYCQACHGEYVNGGTANVSCFSSCHRDFDKCNCCHNNNGTSGSHTTHNTETNNDIGPAQLLCQDCHDCDNHPNFADGENVANTTVCDDCHSPGGTYDGVGDSVNGAKSNWADGIYNAGVLRTDKEKWCIGCHDDVAGNSKKDGSGVNAPNIAGDGITYGFYVNGHGNTPNHEEKLCTDCHDVSFTHIDEDDRTYTFSAADYNNGSSYQAGYRLKSIGGQVPMKIPANVRVEDDDTDYRLCLSCHDSANIFDEAEPFGTNFNISGDNPPKGYSYKRTVAAPGSSLNTHDYHLNDDASMAWDSDWNLSTGGSWDSFSSCVTCHNVHGAAGYAGSTNEAMVRDGKLVDGRPDDREGFRFSYLIEDTGSGGLPVVTSSGANRANSIGAVFRSDKITLGGKHMCKGCHTSTPYSAPAGMSYDATGSYLEYYRTPN